MTQALNFTPKAIADLLNHDVAHNPGVAAGFRYLADKLRQAQVFVVGEHGQLLDRSKPRPEVPCSMLRPPFPVVALEYTAATNEWDMGAYTAVRSSKRIALAWDWSDDLPAILRPWAPRNLGEGVVVASISFFDQHGFWMPIGAASHIAYDQPWEAIVDSPFRQAMIESGRMARKVMAQGKTLPSRAIGLMPEAIAHAVQSQGGVETVMDALAADVMDEANAYCDLSMALACKNVVTRHRPAPAALNRQRIKRGKLPLTGFHVLELRDGGDMPGAGGGERDGPRSHLRRGHIRRLGPERITWVNSAIVRGRGFVDKVYAL